MEEEIKYRDLVSLGGTLNGFYKDIKFKVIGIEQIGCNEFVYKLCNEIDGTILDGMYMGGFFKSQITKIKPIILI